MVSVGRPKGSGLGLRIHKWVSVSSPVKWRLFGNLPFHLSIVDISVNFHAVTCTHTAGQGTLDSADDAPTSGSHRLCCASWHVILKNPGWEQGT